MDFTDAPHRPPPPPPLLTREVGRDDISNPYYIDSPDQVSSPPSFTEALMAASPTSPPLYTPYTVEAERLNRPLTNGQRRFSEEPAYTPGEPEVAKRALVAKLEHEENDKEDEEEEEEEEEIPDLPPLVLITGAGSGLGLALFRHFSAQDPASPDLKYDVLGVDKTPWRLPGKGFQWQTTIGKSGKFVQLDVTASPKRLQTFAKNFLYATVTTARGEKRRYPRPVSLLLHCAGTRGLVGAPPPPPPTTTMTKAGASARAPGSRGGDSIRTRDSMQGRRGELGESLDVMNADTMRHTYDVNVVGTLQLVQAVLPHLQLEAERIRARQDEVTAAFGGSTAWLDELRQQGSRASLQITRPLPPRDPPPRVVVMGSRMGSVGANTVGGGYAYRASQAALIAVLRSLSIDVPEVCFGCVHPGTAKTEEDAVGYEESLEEMVPMFERLGDGKLASGCFVDRFGDPIKW